MGQRNKLQNQMTDISLNRRGHPSPLIFHLSAAAMGYQSAIAKATKPDLAKSDWQPELAKQAEMIGKLSAPLLYQDALRRMRSMINGLEKWQSHPFRRTANDPPVIWSGGSSRLLDFGRCPEATDPEGSPVLVIPSLINRAYILDLDESCSLLRFMASKGLRPLLLDWGVPTDAEQKFDLDSYVIKRIIPAIEVAHSLINKPVGVLGYCMGGTIAAGVLALQRSDVSAFATIGSPWDFSKSKGVTAALRNVAKEPAAAEMIHNIGQTFGMIPTEFFQQLFAQINPMQAAVKFRKFDGLDMNSTAAKQFVAIEDWLADGVPLTTPSAKNILIDWNLNNDTATGRWDLLGQRVDLSRIKQPSLTVCGLRDSITQLDVAAAMANDIPNAQLLTPDAGHVGMIVGSKARKNVWTPVSSFFKDNL